MESRISKLRNHYIICGFGRIGHLICREFQSRPLPFVVVEKDPRLFVRINSEGYMSVADDETLQASITQLEKLARGINSETH